MDRFDRKRGKSASQFFKRYGVIVKLIDEKRIVIIACDPIIVGCTFEGGGSRSSFAGYKKGGETRHQGTSVEFG